MSDDTPSPLNNVIMIGDERHLERVVRGTVFIVSAYDEKSNFQVS
jgi:hypothetical protein